MSSAPELKLRPEWLQVEPASWDVKRAKFVMRERTQLSTDGSETLLSISEYYGVKPRSDRHGDDAHLSRAATLEGYKIVEAGDLAMNIMLAWKGAQGVADERGIVSPAYAVFELDRDSLHPAFAHHLFRTDVYVAEFRRRSTGIIDSRLRLYPETFLAMPVVLPPIEEQICIAAYLDAETQRIDGLIDAKSALLNQLSELRTRAIYEAVFVEEPGWRPSRLKFVADAIIDTEHKTCPYFDDGEFLVVRTTNIKSGKLTLEGAKYTNEEGFREWTQRAVPRPGDILLTREAPAGEACLVPDGLPLCVGQRTVLVQVNQDVAHPEFVLWSLYGGLSSQFIADLSRGSTVPHFNMADIGNIPLFQGPLAEQVARTEVLEQRLGHIYELNEHVNAEVQALKELRTATITDAVLGRIDVRPT